jgi:hypothetical protein
MNKLEAITRAILSTNPFTLESKSVLAPIEINIVEEFNFNNPITLMPEEPIPIDPSDLTYEEPLGYMWSDGIMTETQDRNSRIIKKDNKQDPWIATPAPSIFNQYLEQGKLPEISISDTHIL